MSSNWTIHRLYNDVISDRDTCLQWCEEQGLVPVRRLCSEGHEMFVVQGKTSFGQFRCSKKHSTGKAVTVSRTRDTVFEGKKVSPEKVLIMIYCFAHDLTYQDCITESSIDGGMTSKETVSEFYTFFRELITQHYLEFKSVNKIGGKDKAVEILELSLNRRKFKVGPYDENTCIAVMVECNSKDFCTVICHENEWNNETLFPLIKKKLDKGSIILSNGGRDYSVLSDDGYIIQDSKDYFLLLMKPDSQDLDLNYSSIESLQYKKYSGCKDSGTFKLLEFLYKCEVKNSSLDPFVAFLNIIRHRYCI